MFPPELARGKQIELSQTELYDPSDLSDLSDPSDLSDQSAGSRVLKWFKFAAGVRTTCDCDLEISNTKKQGSAAIKPVIELLDGNIPINGCLIFSRQMRPFTLFGTAPSRFHDPGYAGT